MMTEADGTFKLGGGALVLSGALFFSRALMEFRAGPPPSGGAEILTWVASNKTVLSWVSELLFFAAMALIPGTIALYRALVKTGRAKVALGCGLVAGVIPIIAVSLIVHGRLIYPVFGITVNSPAVAEFDLALFYGGMHAVYEMMAPATFLLSLAMLRTEYGRGIAWLGFVTSGFDIAAAYPEMIGPSLTLLSQLFFAAWLAATGVKLYHLPIHPQSSLV